MRSALRGKSCYVSGACGLSGEVCACVQKRFEEVRRLMGPDIPRAVSTIAILLLFGETATGLEPGDEERGWGVVAATGE